MRSSLRQFILSAGLMALAASAAAQDRVPAAESGAIGGDVGAFTTRAEALDSGPALEGFFEYYFTAGASLRVGLGWADPSFEGDDDRSLRMLRVPMDLVLNAEHGAVHPFAGAGLGIYFVQQQRDGESLTDSETKLGATIFGGAEFFTARTVSVKGEARYHIVGDAFGINPGGLAVTIGVKKYF